MKILNSLICCSYFLFFFSCKKDNNQILNEPYSNFQKTIGGAQDDFGSSIIIATNEIYIIGTTKSMGDINGDHYLIKTDLEGIIITKKTYGGNSAEEGIDIIKTSDGNFIIIGSTESFGAGQKDIHVLKINSDGTILWEKTFGGAQDDTPTDIIELSNSTFCIIGATESYGAGSRDIYTIWIDQNGNLIRQTYYGGTDIDGGTELIEIENQEIMLYGYTRNYGAISRDLYLLKINSIGDSLWSKRYGGTGYEESQAFARTNKGEFVLCGHSSSTDPNHNLFGVKTDKYGNVLFEKNFGGSMHDGGEALLINSDGNYVFVARTMSFGNGMEDVYIVVTNKDGELLSEKLFGGIAIDKIEALVEYNDYYYLIGHSTSFGSGDSDVYFIKQHK